MNATEPTILKCNWCGGSHHSACPLVKRMEFYPDGRLRAIEFQERKIPEQPKLCEHKNKSDTSVMGLQRWDCRDCGHHHEERLA